MRSRSYTAILCLATPLSVAARTKVFEEKASLTCDKTGCKTSKTFDLGFNLNKGHKVTLDVVDQVGDFDWYHEYLEVLVDKKDTGIDCSSGLQCGAGWDCIKNEDVTSFVTTGSGKILVALDATQAVHVNSWTCPLKATVKLTVLQKDGTPNVVHILLVTSFALISLALVFVCYKKGFRCTTKEVETPYFSAAKNGVPAEAVEMTDIVVGQL